MPGFGEDPGVDLDRLDQGAASLPVPAASAYGQTLHDTVFNSGMFRQLDTLTRGISDEYARQAGEAPVTPPKISADQANEQYGLEGAMRFNEPVYEDDAAFLSAQAREQRFSATLNDRSNASPLLTFGAGLVGSLVNPANVGIMVLTDGFAGGALDVAGLTGRSAITGLGRVANVVGEGALAQVPFVAANAAEAHYLGEAYDGGDALRDIAAGAILHTTVHMALRGASGLAGRLDAPSGGPDVVAGGMEPAPGAAASEPPSVFMPNPVPAEGVPGEVDALPPESRNGAFALALDQMAGDRSVDVGGLVARELEPEGLARLDERSAIPAIDSFRPLGDDTAVTTRGTEVLRYGLAELGDLATSHDDNLSVNPAYPAELQPRARERAGAQARNYALEADLNPKLLINDVGAGAGAPIVGPDGVVESGNGRIIALRRNAAAGGEAYGRYKAELAAQGFDTSGMTAPVLVRMRAEPLSGAQRAALAREMNADVTERMSAGEQAMQDASRISDASFEAIPEGRGPTTSRDFAREFIAKVAPDQVGQLVGADGALSPEGARRIKAAVLARAYGDPRLVGQIFEGEETPTRQLGEALAEAAPAWAKLRAAIAAGEVPAELDLTEPLRSAMDLVRFAKEEGEPLAMILADRLGQTDMFSGEAISAQTEAFLRLFYRDEGFGKPEAGAKITAALRDYARQALAVKPGPDLFGDVPSEDTARAILANVAERFQRNDPGDIDVRPPGRSAGQQRDALSTEPEAPLIDLRPPGGDGNRGDGGVSPGGEPGAGGEGRATGESLIAADPELKALREDTDRLAEAAGVEIETPDNQKPDILAEAIRAAAVCIDGEGL